MYNFFLHLNALSTLFWTSLVIIDKIMFKVIEWKKSAALCQWSYHAMITSSANKWLFKSRKICTCMLCVLHFIIHYQLVKIFVRFRNYSSNNLKFEHSCSKAWENVRHEDIDKKLYLFLKII